jgi:hypothetical protein
MLYMQKNKQKKKSGENGEEMISNEQESSSGEEDELGTHFHVDLPRTSYVMQTDLEEDPRPAPDASPSTLARSRPLRVYTRRPRSLLRDPPQDHDRDKLSPTGHVGDSSGQLSADISRDSVSASTESATATSPQSSGQSLPLDGPEEDPDAHDSDVVLSGSSVPSSTTAPHVARMQTRLQKGIKHPQNLYGWYCAIWFTCIYR